MSEQEVCRRRIYGIISRTPRVLLLRIRRQLARQGLEGSKETFMFSYFHISYWKLNATRHTKHTRQDALDNIGEQIGWRWITRQTVLNTIAESTRCSFARNSQWIIVERISHHDYKYKNLIFYVFYVSREYYHASYVYLHACFQLIRIV